MKLSTHPLGFLDYKLIPLVQSRTDLCVQVCLGSLLIPTTARKAQLK
jgi:hypothetical protein